MTTAGPSAVEEAGERRGKDGLNHVHRPMNRCRRARPPRPTPPVVLAEGRGGKEEAATEEAVAAVETTGETAGGVAREMRVEKAEEEGPKTWQVEARRRQQGQRP